MLLFENEWIILISILGHIKNLGDLKNIIQCEWKPYKSIIQLQIWLEIGLFCKLEHCLI